MKSLFVLLLATLPMWGQPFRAAAGLPPGALRLGIIGTDTSHVPAFCGLLNDPAAKDHIPGARVVAAFKGGSPDLPDSANRVEKFAEEIKSKYGVEIVPDIPTLLSRVDAILIESVDGRRHLEQFKQVAAAGKPVFIDKPLASTLEDAREIARENRVPWFSSSSLRFSDELPALRVPGLNGAYVWAPGTLEEHHALDLSWYGIHGVETLYAILGPGCEEVTRYSSPDADVVTGRWRDGRIGTVRLSRPGAGYGAVAFGPKTVKLPQKDIYTGYRSMLVAIVEFFKTGKPPVDERETLEIMSFMDAAQRSKTLLGQPTKLK
jgi:hypothetical protein